MGVGKVPCTKVVALRSGDADEFGVNGDVPILEHLHFTTNGNGPPGCKVLSNAKSNAETLGGEKVVSEPEKNWSLTSLSWSRSSARDGDKVTLRARTSGVPVALRPFR